MKETERTTKYSLWGSVCPSVIFQNCERFLALLPLLNCPRLWCIQPCFCRRGVLKDHILVSIHLSIPLSACINGWLLLYCSIPRKHSFWSCSMFLNLRRYKRLCPFVGPSVRLLYLSVGPSIGHARIEKCEIAFLVADTQLYKRLCPSVRPLVGPWTRVEKWGNAHFRPCPPVRDWWPCIRPCFNVPYVFGERLW